MAISKIVSGGQTGVDRAALDAARAAGLERGGWCPRGRLAEDGPVSASYPLRETPTAEYAERTEWNVRDSDATLILSPLPLEGGTQLTAQLARRLKKPWLALDPRERGALQAAKRWLEETGAETLNVAGPRASRWAEGYGLAKTFLESLLGAENKRQPQR